MTIIEAVQRGLMLFFFVFMILGILWALIILFSKLLKGMEGSKAKENQAMAPPQGEKAPAAPSSGPWGGNLTLENVDEQTAAMIMAIVSDESKIPLSELMFKRISLVNSPGEKSEEEAKA